MSKRTQTYVLGLLLVVLVYLLYSYVFSNNTGSSLAGSFASDAKFQPINVDEPHLRVDLLEKLKRDDYSGGHRNIFAFGPPEPPPMSKLEKSARSTRFMARSLLLLRYPSACPLRSSDLRPCRGTANA